MRMERGIFNGALIVLSLMVTLLLGGVTNVRAAEIRVMSGGAVKPALTELAKTFQKETGHRVDFTFATMGTLQQQVAAGQRTDIYVMTDAAIDDLVKKGIAVAGTRTDIARVGVGVAVREGAPRPDISTPDAFKAALLAAKSLAYIDPDKGGTSGIHVSAILERLGIADNVKAKTILVPSGYVAELVVKGDAEIGIHQISEIMAVKGATLVGPLPRELQKVTVYAAGLGTGSASADAAAAFIRFLTTPAARAKFAEVGLDYRE